MSHSMKVFLSSLSILVNHWSIAAVFFHWFSFVWNNFLKDFLWSSAQILFSSILAGKAFCQLGLWLEKLNYFDKISRKVHIKSVILVKVSDERYIKDLHHIKRLSPQCQSLFIYKQMKFSNLKKVVSLIKFWPDFTRYPSINLQRNRDFCKTGQKPAATY